MNIQLDALKCGISALRVCSELAKMISNAESAEELQLILESMQNELSEATTELAAIESRLKLLMEDQTK